jgi:acetyl esterase/lipase
VGFLFGGTGGGFVLGSAFEKHIDAACREIARLSRVRIVSVDYRKTPENHLMAAMTDMETSVLWALSRYKNIAIGGESAGSVVLLCFEVPKLFVFIQAARLR